MNIENYVLELLQERSLNKDYENKVKEYATSLITFLKKEKKKPAGSAVCPIDNKGDELQYHPPKKIFVSGGFSWGSAYTCEQIDVDVVVEIPKECLLPKDFLNETLLRRRALYLQNLANILSKTINQKINEKDFHKLPLKKAKLENDVNLISRLTFCYKDFSQKMPVLILYPSEESGLTKTRFIVHTSLPIDSFKLNRFHVKKGNVRPKWYKFSGKKDLLEPEQQVLSTHYNSWVVSQLSTQQGHDFIKSSLEGIFTIQQAIVLVKMWLQKRQLDQSYSTGLFVTFFTVHLLRTGVLKKHNSVLHNFTTILQHLSEGGLKKDGVSLVEEHDDVNMPTLEEFLSVHDVVLVDPSGYFNICHDMHESVYDDICYEAKRTLEVLNSCQSDRFSTTFLDTHTHICKFDRIIQLKVADHIRHLCKDSSRLQNHIVNHAGDITKAFLPILFPLLSKALQHRTILITLLPHSPIEVAVNETKGTLHEDIRIGIILDHMTAFNHQVTGPSAELHEEVHEFQKMWGEKSEQVRLMGGEIKEMVTWPSDSMADSRSVVSRIIKFILQRHLKIDKESISMSDNQLDGLLKVAEKKNISDLYGTGEEQMEQVIKSLDKLSNVLRTLPDLPLHINSVQGISPVFRYSEVFPAVRSSNQSDAGVFKFTLVPIHRNNCPQYFPAYQVVCMLEGSNKWTDDLQALNKLKTAFYAHMGKQLKQHGYSCLIYPNKLLLHTPPNTYVFEVLLGIGKEIQLARQMDPSLYQQLNFTFNIFPVYNSTIHGIQQKNNNFSSSLRLSKRWVSSQLLWHYIPEVAIELIMCHVFTCQHAPPSSPLLGFIRFLHLVSTHDWKLDPLIVNLNQEFKEGDYLEIEEYFQRNRPQLASMFISTPFDPHSQMWTASKPSAVMLTRLVLAAQASLQVLNHISHDLAAFNKQDYKQLFRPPTEDYNVLLHLNLLKCSRYHQGVDFSFNSSHPPPSNISRSESLFPVVGFDPASNLLNELRHEFESFALFFYDIFGGPYIAIAWKPSAFKPIPYQPNATKFHKVLEDTLNSEQAMMVACEDLLLKQIKKIGSLIIKRTEVINSII